MSTKLFINAFRSLFTYCWTRTGFEYSHNAIWWNLVIFFFVQAENEPSKTRLNVSLAKSLFRSALWGLILFSHKLLYKVNKMFQNVMIKAPIFCAIWLHIGILVHSVAVVYGLRSGHFRVIIKQNYVSPNLSIKLTINEMSSYFNQTMIIGRVKRGGGTHLFLPKFNTKCTKQASIYKQKSLWNCYIT